MVKEKEDNLEVGDSLGHYRIVSKIGAGGMGEVYLAEDTKLDRKVALKILPPEFSEDKDRMSRFVREAKSASALNHPNIITIHEINEFDGTHFIATEFIDGETLNEYAKSHSLNFKSAVDIAIQIASALDEAHQAGIVHRDIKPDNIMVRANGLVKILDFGIAKLSDSNNQSSPDAVTVIQNVTSPGMIIGTPKFMSPEQARGKDIDHQTDIFSFGIVLYEMLSGNSPFTGETAGDILASVLTKEPKSLREINPETPPELDAIVSKSLRKDKRRRYQTAKNLLQDLTELKQELEIQKRLKKTAAPNREDAKTQIIKPQITTETETQPSIAVMPFANLSADAENDYFCDGLAEELLNALAKIDELKVAARTSAFSFRGKNTNISEIGRILNVNTVLEGSVRRAGTRLRIIVQLINSADGFYLWSEKYDREMENIFDVQDEITLAVVDALKVELLGGKKSAILKRYTDNAEAYELYLKGLFFYNKHTEESWLKAIEYFEQAVALEPEHAPAYAGIGSCCATLWFYCFLPSEKIVSKWKANAERALEIDENLPEAHFTMGGFQFVHEWNLPEAEREYRRAIELKPNSPDAFWRLGLVLVAGRKFDEAIVQAEKALELDPLSLSVNLYAGHIYRYANHFDEAFTQAQKLIEIEPRFYGAYWLLGILYKTQGKFEDAIIEYQKSLALGGNQTVLSNLGDAYALAGKTDEALQTLDKLFEMSKKQYVAALNIARIYCGLGENDKAFEWFEKAFEERDGELIFLNVQTSVGKDFLFRKTVRQDARFTNLLHRIGFK